MNYLKNLTNYIDNNIVAYSITILIVIIFLIIRFLLIKIVKRHAANTEVANSRVVYIKKLIGLVLLLLFISIIGMVWEISLKGLSVYFASVFTVVGVGLFANWSILSNLTASVVLFFFFPHRIGGHIKIIDGDNSIEGTVVDITLFYFKIESSNGEIYSYPNNLIIQKPVKHPN